MTREEIMNMSEEELRTAIIDNIWFYHSESFQPTMNIEDAWRVKEKIGLPISLVESMLGDSFSCEFLIDYDKWKVVEAVGMTAPLAICRAALLTLEAK